MQSCLVIKGHAFKSLNILYSLCKLVVRGCSICISSVKSAYLKRTWSKIWTEFTYFCAFIVWLNHKNQIPLDRVVNGTKLSESKPIQNLWDFGKPVLEKKHLCAFELKKGSNCSSNDGYNLKLFQPRLCFRQ